ncbi:MAG: RagB/SusD family nutrient uptake outer membrane protein [Rikenellaceae bacterium]
MKIYKLYILLLAAVATTSCEDLLNQENPNESSVETYWGSLSDTEIVLNSVYNALYNHGVMSIEEMTLCSDMGYPGLYRNGNPTDETLASFYQHTYTKSTGDIEDKWSALYTGIFRANQVIEGLNTLIENESTTMNDEWYEQMGQARFFRGLFHFYLHSVFNNGEIIIFDAIPQTNTDYYKSVSDADVVQAFFRDDLIYAYEHLPANYGTTKDYRVARGAAATVLGTTYLYSEEFDQALIYLTDVITNSDYGYELETDMDNMFTTAGEFNCESIFEINYQSGIHPELTAWDESSPTNRLGYTSTTQSFTLPCWIVDAYQTEEMNVDDDRNKISYTDEDGIIRDDSVRTLSLRGSAMVAVVQDDNTSYYLEPITSEVVSVSNTKSVGYYRKYSNWDIIDDESDMPDGQRKSGKNVTVNRLAEVYLMYAECMLRKDTPNITEALKYMNLIRDRWALQLLGTPGQNPSFSADKYYNGVTYTAETLFTQLQDYDRPLELSAEGHALRFIDLRRWGANYAKERYTKLSQQTYKLVERVVPSGTTRWGTWVQLGAYDPDVDKYEYNELVDYTAAAANYTDTYAYWPIPLTEEQNNYNLYNK